MFKKEKENIALIYVVLKGNFKLWYIVLQIIWFYKILMF